MRQLVQVSADRNPCTSDFHLVICRDPVITMQLRKRKIRIELGMKVSVRRSGQNQIGVVTRIEGHYVFVRWTNSDFGETAEYQAHRDDVTPLAGWL